MSATSMVTAEVPERQAHLRCDNASLEDARSVARRLCALRFIETFDDASSLQPGEPKDPKDPVELIDLVLETYGEQTIGLFDLFQAAQILVAHPRAWRSISSVTPGMETLPSSCRIMSVEAQTICGFT